MKAIILPCTPSECEKIANGDMSILVRKKVPKETAFKVYVYCTKGKPYLYRVDDDNNFELTNTLRPKTYEYVKDYNEQNGKVIGEFVCDNVERFSVGSLRSDDIEKLACLSYTEMINYFYKPEELDGKTAKQGYALHIPDLKIYDKPKELSEFNKQDKMAIKTCKYRVRAGQPEYVTKHGGWLNGTFACEKEDDYITWCRNCLTKQISRPPKNYIYVEE